MEQTLKPFSEISTCIKCGISEQLRQMQDFGPPSVFLPQGKIPGVILTRYCAGGKEPEERPEESPDPMAHIAAIFSKVASVHNQVGALVPAKLNICAGIGEEHLHKTCSACGYEWLMKTKDREVVG